MYKLIFIDIDGTLTNSKKEVTQRTIDAIKNIESKGIKVVLTTGRPIIYTENICNICGTSNYIISSNGASVYDYINKKVIYIDKMDKEACLKIYNIVKNEDVRYLLAIDRVRYVNKLKYFNDTEIQLNDDITDIVYSKDIAQCTITGNDREVIKKVIEKVKNIEKVSIKCKHDCLEDENIMPKNGIYVDIANNSVSKGNAIKELCKYLNVNINETIGIGDGRNDIPMLQSVGYSVVMNNASDIVKEHANRIINSNDEDGVAQFLEELYNQI